MKHAQKLIECLLFTNIIGIFVLNILVMFEGINQIEFSKQFHSNDACYEYLVKHKWRKGFACIRCRGTAWYKGRTSYHRRCKKCMYDESVTSNTVFHDLKMPILKAFQMMFRVVSKKKGISTVELGTEVGVQQKTAWFFKRKLQIAMRPGKSEVLKNKVEMDETLIGGYSEKEPGRSLADKRAVMIGVEKLDDERIGNIGLKHIEGFESDIFHQAVDEMVEKGSQITTDDYPSWVALKKEMPNLATRKSQKGKSFKELHQQIMLVKIWLRGIHHKCSPAYLQDYLNEYAFRFNNRNCRRWIFQRLLSNLMHLEPQPFKRKTRVCACIT